MSGVGAQGPSRASEHLGNWLLTSVECTLSILILNPLRMSFPTIVLSFGICAASSLLCHGLVRPGSNLFPMFFILQILMYSVLTASNALLNKIHVRGPLLNFVISCVLGYGALMMVLWDINGSGLIRVMIEVHTGREFWILPFPYLAINTLIILYIVIFPRFHLQVG